MVWNDGSLESATWESAAVIREQFPGFHLEDKVNPNGGVNDTGVDMEDAAGESVETVEPRRSGRVNKSNTKLVGFVSG